MKAIPLFRNLAVNDLLSHPVRPSQDGFRVGPPLLGVGVRVLHSVERQFNVVVRSPPVAVVAKESSASVLPRYQRSSIDGMKVSVSLPQDDVAFLDSYARDQGFGSRSAVLHKAVRLLRAAELGDAYEGAWQEWRDDGDVEAWAVSSADGLDS